MNFFGDFTFFLYLLIAIVPAILLGVLEKPLKTYTTFATIAFILIAFVPEPTQLLYLFCFYLLECGLLKCYLRHRTNCGRVPFVYHASVLISILPLVLSKVTPFFDLNLFGFLGISYLTFRIVQMVIEVYDGVITSISLWDVTGYVFFFPSLSCGPIDRSRRFLEDARRIPPRQEYLDMLGDGLFKILLGVTYKFVIAGILYPIMTGLLDEPVWYANIGYAYVYGFHMFFDFAGYSLMAVGTSYIFGIRTPDNFHLPFISKDIKDFWNRWHITLSHWFRDFIFSRFIMDAMKHKWFKSKQTQASVGFMINMLVMGLWHGLTWSYILYGLYHGVLLALTEIYQKKSKFYKKYKKAGWYQAGSWFLTLQLVMFGFFLFSGRFLEIILH